MFLITKLNNEIIIGPRPNWHQPLFQAAVDDEFLDDGIVIKIPPYPPTTNTTLSEIKIYHVSDVGVEGEYNPKIQTLNGPFFTFSDIAEQRWLPIDKTPDQIKSELIAEVASNRWLLETGGTSTTIQDLTITLSTARGERDIFAQALLLGSTGATWKFNEGWLILSNAELGMIVGAIMYHVQMSFTWEGQKVTEINACSTIEELALVETRHTSQIPVE